MANENQKSTTAPVVASNLEQQLAAALAALAESNTKMTQLMERQADYSKEALKIAPRRRKTMAEYLKQNPRKRLLHEVYQNSRLVNPKGLSVQTIELLDTLATGSYCDGLVDVVRFKDGPEGINTRIHLMYNTKHEAQRMQVYMRFPTFTSMVNQIAAEMAARVGVEGTPNYDPRYLPVKDKAADPVQEVFPDDL